MYPFKAKKKQTTFFELFKGVSDELQKIAALFDEFAGHFDKADEYAQKAKDIEHAADSKTHAIVDKLNKTFITPFDREDIYLLASELDDIVDLIEKVIHDIALYKITEKIPAINEFAPLISEGSLYIGKLVECMQSQKHGARLLSYKIKLHDLEDKGDIAFDSGLQNIFTGNNDPIMVIKLKDVLEGLEQIMDKYQKVSNIVEGIMVKSS